MPCRVVIKYSIFLFVTSENVVGICFLWPWTNYTLCVYSQDEKEQLLQYRNTVAGLVGRAKNIVQLRPRNPENPLRSSIPVKAICDYRQIEVLLFFSTSYSSFSPFISEFVWYISMVPLSHISQITIYKDDECVLVSNSHRAKWKVINPAGNEAMVPSVCFSLPPPNKEAVDLAARWYIWIQGLILWLIIEHDCLNYFTFSIELSSCTKRSSHYGTAPTSTWRVWCPGIISWLTYRPSATGTWPRYL